MPDTILPVQLNKGLDLVTTPLLVQEGSLIDCLNYELTDIAGYRRIDGYERFDGFPDGGNILEYYQMTITAEFPGDQGFITVGGVVNAYNNTTGGYEDILLIVESLGGTLYNIMPLSPNLRDYLGGAAFTYDYGSPTADIFGVVLGSTVTLGSELVDYDEYITNLRQYSNANRAAVYTHDRPIAGLHWLERNLFAALDTIRMTGPTTVSADTLTPGQRFLYNGFSYRLVHMEPTSGGNSYLYLARESYAENDSNTPDNQLRLLSEQGGIIRTWISDVAASADLQTGASQYAAMYKYRNPMDETFRGMDLLPSGLSMAYTLGDTVSGTMPAITLEDGNDAADVYYYIYDGYVLKVRLSQITQTGGSFTDGTATGTIQFNVISRVAGTTPGYVYPGGELHNAYPTTGTSRVLTGSGAITGSPLAGTLALWGADTRYVWDTYNFYGQAATLSLYGTTGTSRAFWANENGYGTINTGLSDERDVPKYVAFHVGKLALGYAEGSIQLSVVGEPYNFLGTDGAIEIATGDNVTGLLELPGDTLGVFGKRAIRKITGYTETDTTLGSIASGSSCFDYTAVMVGQDAVYTGPHGITSLAQSAAYGDFVGERLSDRVSTWLRPKLVKEFTSLELGGTVCAIPVRNKQQYRLFLKTGEVLVCTLTEEGPRLTFSNYGLGGEIRIPFAWSSAVDDEGQEKIHIRWDVAGEESQAYSLDRGWSFDGAYFRHYFDVAHVFNKSGSQFMGVERVRMYGQGYGVATLNIKSSGIESNFDQDYHEAVQDISMPATPYVFYGRMQPVMAIVDQANWGLGVKLRIGHTTAEGSTEVEPSHICQVLVLHTRTEGAGDN